MFLVSYVAITVRARVRGLDWTLEDAAMDLGASPMRTFWKVTLPLITPGILAAALLAFALSIDDFIITYFVVGSRHDDLPGSNLQPVADCDTAADQRTVDDDPDRERHGARRGHRVRRLSPEPHHVIDGYARLAPLASRLVMELEEAGAIVTGGASGIGAATVAALQAVGARVASLDLTKSAAADVSICTDVADEAQVVAGVARAADALGGIHVAVVNAGIGGMSPLLEMPAAEWDRVMAVNLRGAFLTLRECGKAMLGSSGGAIVAVTSVSGFLTERLMAHYSVSKAGLAALVRVAARELGPHRIRVNGVAPGTTATPLFAATDRLPGYQERAASRTALGRLGTAEDVAEVIVALCRLEWVTGQIVAADGGVSLASPIDPADSFDARP